jgi:hypothetical protein
MTLSTKQKELLKEFCNFKCEQCNKKFESKELIIHHLTRRCIEIDDCFRNLKVVCKDCSKKIHFKEFKRSGG